MLLQVQRSGLKNPAPAGAVVARQFDPAPLLEVPALRLTPDGVLGLVEGRQGVGTFAVRRPAGPPPGMQLRLARSLERWVQTARDAGLDDEAIESMLRGALSSARAQDIA